MFPQTPWELGPRDHHVLVPIVLPVVTVSCPVDVNELREGLSNEFSSTLLIITVPRLKLIRVTSSHSLTPRVILTALLCKGFVRR